MKKQSSSIAEEIKSIIYVVFIALIVRAFVMELFFVPTGSMKATILEQDYLFATKYSYGYSRYSIPFSPDIFGGKRIFAAAPQRGDIVIFRPPNNMNIRYIKRLIGLPGDKIQIIDNLIYINDRAIERLEIGQWIDEQGKVYVKYKETLPNNVSYMSYKFAHHNVNSFDDKSNTEIFYVPNGHYFFLGDNRDDSGDSRFGLGFVPFENFIAKGQFIFFSTKELLWLDDIKIIEQVKRFATWITSIRFNRIFHSIYNINI